MINAMTTRLKREATPKARTKTIQTVSPTRISDEGGTLERRPAMKNSANDDDDVCSLKIALPRLQAQTDDRNGCVELTTNSVDGRLFKALHAKRQENA